MNKIVAVTASPKVNGNSDTILNAVTDGAMGLSTNLIDLYRLDRCRTLRGCSACDKCNETGRCIHDDDIQVILDDMIDADVVIMSTPVYFGEVTSQYKVLEDRMYCFYNSQDVHDMPPNKKAVVIVSCSEPIVIAEKVADRMSKTLETLGFEITDKLLFSDEGKTKHARDDKELMNLAKKAGARFRNT